MVMVSIFESMIGGNYDYKYKSHPRHPLNNMNHHSLLVALLVLHSRTYFHYYRDRQLVVLAVALLAEPEVVRTYCHYCMDPPQLVELAAVRRQVVVVVVPLQVVGPQRVV